MVVAGGRRYYYIREADTIIIPFSLYDKNRAAAPLGGPPLILKRRERKTMDKSVWQVCLSGLMIAGANRSVNGIVIVFTICLHPLSCFALTGELGRAII